ncbi:MAG: hypothetical protein IPO62_07915 [Saprospiraceae bacterium]|nr:hypothetical protein [Saprospiraceae bacterium]
MQIGTYKAFPLWDNFLTTERQGIDSSESRYILFKSQKSYSLLPCVSLYYTFKNNISFGFGYKPLKYKFSTEYDFGAAQELFEVFELESHLVTMFTGFQIKVNRNFNILPTFNIGLMLGNRENLHRSVILRGPFRILNTTLYSNKGLGTNFQTEVNFIYKLRSIPISFTFSMGIGMGTWTPKEAMYTKYENAGGANILPTLPNNRKYFHVKTKCFSDDANADYGCITDYYINYINYYFQFSIIYAFKNL